MNTYKVTVCRFGSITVEAESEEEAKTMVSKFMPEQIHWAGPTDKMPLFIITYAELEQ